MKFSIITVVKNGISKMGLTIKSLKNQSLKIFPEFSGYLKKIM